ncbi:MAG: cell division ATP-binding protein FtsE, partial [Clostridia bacterium]|nr:cell division ATP-binding protein FtsE [Clostridia bacterium]
TGVRAFDNVSFFIDKGEFVFLVGPSGAGKSTLTKLLIKEEEPNSGEITVNGFDLGSLTKNKIPYLRRSIGMVFQDFRLLPNKTVYENVAFAMQVIGASRSEIRRSVPNVLSLVGLAHKARMKPSQLSGGEQQRVSLARALVNKPPVIIADEPTGNLDPDTATEIMELLCEINKRGTTMIVATHAKNFVDEMQKRVLAIENGVLVRDEEEGTYGYDI